MWLIFDCLSFVCFFGYTPLLVVVSLSLSLTSFDCFIYDL